MPPTAPDDQTDFEARVRDELRDHENIEEYEIVESTPGHVEVRVTEHTTEDETQTVLFRLEDKATPEGRSEINWKYLGAVDDEVED